MTREYLIRFQVKFRAGENGTSKPRTINIPGQTSIVLPMWERWVLIPSEGIENGIVVRSKRGVLGEPSILQQFEHTGRVEVINTNPSGQFNALEFYIVTPQ